MLNPPVAAALNSVQPENQASGSVNAQILVPNGTQSQGQGSSSALANGPTSTSNNCQFRRPNATALNRPTITSSTGQPGSQSVTRVHHAPILKQSQSQVPAPQNVQAIAPGTGQSQGQNQALATNQATAAPVRKPFAEFLHEYVPYNSPLMVSIERRETRAWIKERDSWDSTAIDLATVKTHLTNLRTSQPRSDCSVLIVEDIKPNLAEILLSEFPQTVHQEFLAHNMIRFDSSSATDESVERLRCAMSERHHGPQLEVDPSGGKVKISNIPPLPPNHNGFHMDCNIRPTIKLKLPSTLRRFEGLRPDHFEKDFSDHWRRTSTRLSVCKLDNQLYLILVDAMPDLDRHPYPLWEVLTKIPFQSTLEINIGPELASLRLPIELEPRDNSIDGVRSYRNDSTGCMKTIVSRLLRSHTAQSILNPKAMPQHRTDSEQGNFEVFSLLLTESAWQSVVTTLEETLQRRHCDATRSTDDGAFKLLRKARRQIADARMLIAESRDRCTQIVAKADLWMVDGRSTEANKFWSKKPVVPILRHARSKNIRHFFDSMEKLESRVLAMSQAMNEEMQVVIGAVQVEDAKIMKRQTEWGVVLTVLAAIYLPMTLVTGIFGMNIKETNTDATRPDKWAVYATWGGIFGGTVVCILLYVAARWPIGWILGRIEMNLRRDLGPAALKLTVAALDSLHGRMYPAWYRHLYRRLAILVWVGAITHWSKRFEKNLEKDLEAQKAE